MNYDIVSQRYTKRLSSKQRAERKAKFYAKLKARWEKIEKENKVKLKFF